MNWNQTAGQYLAVADEVFGTLQEKTVELARLMVRCVAAGNKIMICGNGGSAADAQHFSGELINKFFRVRRPYAGLALTTDTSVLTSIGNDFGYEQVFEKQVQALGKPGDILVAISTSGKAENVCRAVQTARSMGIVTIAMTGGQGGRLAGLADHVLSIAGSDITPRIQEGHQLLIHILCEIVEEELS